MRQNQLKCELSYNYKSSLPLLWKQNPTDHACVHNQASSRCHSWIQQFQATHPHSVSLLGLYSIRSSCHKKKLYVPNLSTINTNALNLASEGRTCHYYRPESTKSVIYSLIITMTSSLPNTHWKCKEENDTRQNIKEFVVLYPSHAYKNIHCHYTSRNSYQSS